jgi:hypothetical protein
MTEIDDRFILNSILPASPVAKAPRFGVLSRFMNSGVAAAVISGVVAVGVLVAIVLAGRNTPSLPPVTTDDPPPVTESTEEESGRETEEVTENESEPETDSPPEIIMTPEELKAATYEMLDNFNIYDYCPEYICSPFYPIGPATYWEGSDKAYEYVTAYGKESIPYILEYIIFEDPEMWCNGYYDYSHHLVPSRGFLMASVYDMLGVTEWYGEAWIHPTNDFNYCADLAAIPLLEFINCYGMDAVREWADVCVTLNAMEWSEEDYTAITENKLNSPASSLLKDKYEAIAAHGEEAVPFVLRYILQMGQPLSEGNRYDTPKKREKRMTFYLACVYEMMGVTSADQWLGVEGKVSMSEFRTYTRALLDTVEQPYRFEGQKQEVYDLLDSFNASDYFDAILYNGDAMGFPTADTPGFREAYNALSVLGVDSIPYMMEYVASARPEVLYSNYPDKWETFERNVILTVAYHMLGVTGDPATSWICLPQGGPYTQRCATFLLEFLNRYGPDSFTLRAEVYGLLDTLWLTDKEAREDLKFPVSTHYPDTYRALQALGDGAIPFILQYSIEDAGYLGSPKPYDEAEWKSKKLFRWVACELLGLDPTAPSTPPTLDLLDRLADEGIEAVRAQNP